jgi:hypothetical protein
MRNPWRHDLVRKKLIDPRTNDRQRMLRAFQISSKGWKEFTRSNADEAYR